MLLELLVIGAMSKWYFGWRSFFAADSILFTVLEYFSVPMLVGAGVSLQKQLCIQFCTMTGRAIELAGGSILVWYNIHANPQKPHLYVASFAVASAFAFAVAVAIVILDRRWRYLGEPLLPAANSKGYGKIHWASALNNQALLRKIPYNELRHSDSEQSFAHVAAKHGQKDVLQFFQEIVPETLKSAAGNGELPAHLAAYNGHEGVVQFLHQVLPETLKTANGGGYLPAHLAAENGHEGVVQFLHQVLPETLKTAAGDGYLPAHWAAQNGHESVLQFLHQVLPETLTTANGNGMLPAHLAAYNGHEGVVQFLHQVLPETLTTADGNGMLPAHLAAENGHEGVVQFLHQVVPETLKAADRDGGLPAHWAAHNGHEGVLQFLHQVVPETLKTANANGAMPAHWAAINGHEGVLQFLHQVVPETLKTADRNGAMPAHFAALDGHGHEGVIQFLHQVVPETLKTAAGDDVNLVLLAVEMSMKEWSNFSTKWFLTLLQLHPNKMLRCACLMKMTVAKVARCREKPPKISKSCESKNWVAWFVPAWRSKMQRPNLKLVKVDNEAPGIFFDTHPRYGGAFGGAVWIKRGCMLHTITTISCHFMTFPISYHSYFITFHTISFHFQSFTSPRCTYEQNWNMLKLILMLVVPFLWR